MAYTIEELYDDYDCETCGGSYAQGYIIKKDDVVIVDKTPSAHCFGGYDYSNDNPYKDILSLECPGIEVEMIDGC
jgi:hypothetical protein